MVHSRQVDYLVYFMQHLLTPNSAKLSCTQNTYFNLEIVAVVLVSLLDVSMESVGSDGYSNSLMT